MFSGCVHPPAFDASAFPLCGFHILLRPVLVFGLPCSFGIIQPQLNSACCVFGHLRTHEFGSSNCYGQCEGNKTYYITVFILEETSSNFKVFAYIK